MLDRLTWLAVLLLLLQQWLASGDYVRSLTSTVLSRAKRIGENVQRLQPSTVLFIDGDNVRGKTGFSISKERLVEDVLHFQQRFGFSHRVVLLFDHGAEHEGFALTCQQQPEASLALVFSGAKTADDIIARDCGYFLRVARVPVCVVTSDAGLKGRCQRAAKSAPWAVEGGTSIVGQGAVRPVSFIDSNTFIELLGAVASGELDVNDNDASIAPAPAPVTEATATTTSTADVIDTDAKAEAVAASRADNPDQADAAATPLDPLQSTRLAELARRELRLRQQVRSLDLLLERKSQGRKKLARLRERRGEIVRALDKLLVEGGGWSLEEGSDGGEGVGQEGDDVEEEEGEVGERGEAAGASVPPRQADAAFVDSLLLLGAGRGKEGGYREETWQRCILAERLRASVLMHAVTSLAATTAADARARAASGAVAGTGSATERERQDVSALPFSRTTAVFPAFPSVALDAALSASAAEAAPSAVPATLTYLREINRAYSRTNLAKLVDLCCSAGGGRTEAPGAGAGVGLGMDAALSPGAAAAAAADSLLLQARPPNSSTAALPALASATASAAADDRLAMLRAAIGPASLAAALPPQARKAMVQAGVGWKGRKGSGKRRG